MRVCAVCSRAARGFYYTHLLRPDRYPTFAFCSRRCQRAGAAIAKRKNGMIDKTEMEAARDQGRAPVPRRGADRARSDGALPRPHRREIDRIIEACVDGFQDSMQRQSLNANSILRWRR